MHVPWPRVWKLWQLLGAQFFGTMVLMKFVLKNLCRQLCIFSGLPANEALHVPSPNVCKSLKKAWAHSFSAQSHSWSLSWKPGLTALLLSMRLPPNKALPKVFPTVSHPSTMSTLPSRSLPMQLSPIYFPRFPIRPRCPRFLPTELSPSIRPQCPRFRLPPSQQCSPPVISDGFLSVHDVHASVSLPANGALPKLFPTVHASVSLPHTELSPGYFPRLPVRPPCRRFHLAPSQWSSPQAITVLASTLPSRSLPMDLSKLFPTVSCPSTMSALPSRSLPTGLSPSYFPRFPAPLPKSFPMVSHPSMVSNGALPKLFPTVSRPSTMSTPPNGALPWFSRPSTLSSLPSRSFTTELSPSYFPRFPVRPPYRRFHLAPFQRSCPQAISHGFPSVHPVVAPISLPPNGALSYFPRFPVRPPCPRFHLAPSQRSSLPKLFPTVSCPSIPYRSPAAKQTKREPKHRRCFWEKLEIMKIEQFNQLFE